MDAIKQDGIFAMRKGGESTLKLYILDDAGNPVRERDLNKWSDWIEGRDRSLKLTNLDGIEIVTYFLGIDHNPLGIGEAQLYETKAMAGGRAGVIRRYATKDEALAGHDAAALEARSAMEWRDSGYGAGVK